MNPANFSLDIQSLRDAYAAGTLTPSALVNEIAKRSDDDTHRIWIHRLPLQTMLAFARKLESATPADLPLYGVPFAFMRVKKAFAHPDGIWRDFDQFIVVDIGNRLFQ